MEKAPEVLSKNHLIKVIANRNGALSERRRLIVESVQNGYPFSRKGITVLYYLLKKRRQSFSVS